MGYGSLPYPINIIGLIRSDDCRTLYGSLDTLHERGVEEPLLFVADGLPGVLDRNEIDSDLKGIFLSRTREEALNQFNEFRDKWSSKYPKPVYNMEKNLGTLLKYHDYPESIRRSIHSTNLIERMNKEIRHRIKIIDSLPSEESAMKMIYLRSAEINEQWSLRSPRGFYKCKDEIREMFQKRYPL